MKRRVLNMEVMKTGCTKNGKLHSNQNKASVHSVSCQPVFTRWKHAFKKDRYTINTMQIWLLLEVWLEDCYFYVLTKCKVEKYLKQTPKGRAKSIG